MPSELTVTSIKAKAHRVLRLGTARTRVIVLLNLQEVHPTEEEEIMITEAANCGALATKTTLTVDLPTMMLDHLTKLQDLHMTAPETDPRLLAPHRTTTERHR